MYKFWAFIIEAIGWLQIVASPLLIGFGTGAVVYFSKPDTTRLVIGISISALGLIIGIVWATKIWKNHGTIASLTRIMATPDLDEAKESGEIAITDEQKKN